MNTGNVSQGVSASRAFSHPKCEEHAKVKEGRLESYSVSTDALSYLYSDMLM